MKFDCKYDAMLEIEKIVRHPRNNNMHPIEQIEAFQRIISKKGVWRIPLIISKKSGFLVAGHLRLTVAESMGLERLPVVYQDFESEADEYQFLTFDNEIARWAKLDRHEVHLALEEIEAHGTTGLELFPRLDLLGQQLHRSTPQRPRRNSTSPFLPLLKPCGK